MDRQRLSELRSIHTRGDLYYLPFSGLVVRKLRGKSRRMNASVGSAFFPKD